MNKLRQRQQGWNQDFMVGGEETSRERKWLCGEVDVEISDSPTAIHTRPPTPGRYRYGEQRPKKTFRLNTEQ